jgi:hypothetical protein
MEELIQRVAAAAGIEPGKAETAIGMIFAFLKKDGPAAEVEALLADLPGASEAVAKAEADSNSNGLLAGLAGAIGGGLMGLAGQLTALGLGMSEMQTVGKEVFAFAREKAGDERIGQIVGAIPGLNQFL